MTGANVHDSRALPDLLDAVRAAGFAEVRRVYADSGYGGFARGAAARGFTIEIAKRSDYTEANRAKAKASGRAFVPLPKRWARERTFSWLTWCRKLTASHDRRTRVVEAWVLLGSLRHTLSKF